MRALNTSGSIPSAPAKGDCRWAGWEMMGCWAEAGARPPEWEWEERRGIPAGSQEVGGKGQEGEGSPERWCRRENEQRS